MHVGGGMWLPGIYTDVFKVCLCYRECTHTYFAFARLLSRTIQSIYSLYLQQFSDSRFFASLCLSAVISFTFLSLLVTCCNGDVVTGNHNASTGTGWAIFYLQNLYLSTIISFLCWKIFSSDPDLSFEPGRLNDWRRCRPNIIVIL